MKEAMRFISPAPKPLVVTAGVPILIPLVTAGGLGSKGMVFLFTEIPALHKANSASLPLIPCGERSTMTV
jgi:hypothetical protein